MKDSASLIVRYFILLIIGLTNLSIIYWVFTPLTVYGSYFILSKLTEASLISSTVIFTNGYYAKIIPACVGGAAYYLLLILNLTTPMKVKQRVYTLIFSLISFLLLNIIRITLFALLVPKGYHYFDLAHELTWYVGSTVFVVIIWFSSTFGFHIKEMPIYSDLKSLYNQSLVRS